jgi:predicted RNase H-like HicB family nuclease
VGFKGAGFLVRSPFHAVNSHRNFLLASGEFGMKEETRTLHKNGEECGTRKFSPPPEPGAPSGRRFDTIALRVSENIVKRQVHLANVEEVAIRVRVERLKGGRYLGTSPDVPGLVAEGRSVSETIEIAQSLARKIVESCREHGDPLPAIFRNGHSTAREFRVPVMMP